MQLINKIERALILCSLLIMMYGCSLNAGGMPRTYLCNEMGTCSMPERKVEGKARIYIFRPAFILNSSEQHDLYRIIGKNKEYVCTLTSGKYAVLHLWPQFVSLEIRGGVNNASMEFYAEADRSYYVSHEVKASLGTKLRSKLYLVSSEEGERLLRTKIAGKCFKKYKQIKGDQ